MKKMDSFDAIHLTTVHNPLDTRIFHKEIKSLTSAGFRIKYIAKSPPDIRIHNLEIDPLPMPRGKLERVTTLMQQAYAKIKSTDAKILHIHDPELIPLALVFKRRGMKVIYDAHEDFPKQVMGKDWIPSFLKPPVSAAAYLLESLASKYFDAIVVANPPVIQKFPPKKTILIRNLPILKRFEPVYNLVPYQNRDKALIYVGKIGRIRSIREIILALGLVSDVTLHLIGDFDDRTLFEEMQRLPGWSKVKYYGWQDYSQMIPLLAQARAGLALLKPVPNFRTNIPVKVLEYMAAGLPVIASNFDSYWKKIFDETGAGILVSPDDPSEIASAIRWLFSHPDVAEEMGRRGRNYVFKNCSWEHESTKLVSLYKKLLKNM